MRLTPQLERVLSVFLEDPTVPRHGYDLMKAASLPSGTLYPMLARLEDEGLVSSKWGDAGPNGRPPRRNYLLTPEGARVARQELAESSLDARRVTLRRMRPARGAP